MATIGRMALIEQKSRTYDEEEEEEEEARTSVKKGRPVKKARAMKATIKQFQHQANSKMKTKKTVRFACEGKASSVSFRPICREEVRELWIQPYEYGNFERSRRNTIAAFREAKGILSSLDPREHCLLGLEDQLSRKQIFTRRFTTKQYIRLVLEQEHLERRLGVHHKQASMISEMFSRQAMKRAHLRAVLGSLQVKDDP